MARERRAEVGGLGPEDEEGFDMFEKDILWCHRNSISVKVCGRTSTSTLSPVVAYLPKHATRISSPMRKLKIGHAEGEMHPPR